MTNVQRMLRSQAPNISSRNAAWKERLSIYFCPFESLVEEMHSVLEHLLPSLLFLLFLDTLVTVRHLITRSFMMC